MPSLKDLRNRIASVKATQKITKAMQMVAAAKLRRAQMAAEAARPFAERMTTVMANLAGGITIGPESPRLMAGTGRTRPSPRSSHRRARPLRRVQFLYRAARPRPCHSPHGEGKTVKILCVGKKGCDILRRQFDADHRAGRLPGREADGLRRGRADRAEGPGALRGGRVRRRDRLLFALPLGHPADPDRAADHPGRDRGRRPTANDAVYEYEPDENEILASLLPRNIAVQILRALLENAASEQGARMCAMDSRPATPAT